jgi:hypothetical protein
VYGYCDHAMVTTTKAEQLLRDALTVPFRGWDFSVLGDRIVLEPPPWPFEEIVDEVARRAVSMLDMGTGGGEWLSRRVHAARTVATEGWSPNVPIAAARLRPLGVAVVHDEGAVDNVDQVGGAVRGRLPFRTAAFDLVVNRHEAFAANEVCRVLHEGGAFVTQQSTSGAREFHELLGLGPPEDREFPVQVAIEQIESAGLRVREHEVGIATTVFADIGALAWYLTNVPWAISGFSIERHRDALLRLHGSSIRVPSERFWIRAHHER